MMTKKILLISIGLLLVGQFVGAAMNSSNYQIWGDNLSTGGDDGSDSANYSLQDTVEQGISGSQASSTNYGDTSSFRSNPYFEGQEVLTLSVGSGSVNLGELSSSAAKTGSHTLTVDSNSFYGLSVTVAGSTLTCSACGGTNTVTAIGGAAVASTPGSSQFGLNVIYSSGSSPRASASSPYSTSGQYAFQSGNEVISATGNINSTVFNVNYLANISGSETAGTYTTTITYTATANF